MALLVFEIIDKPDSLQISTDDTEENPIVQNLPHLHRLLCLHVQCTFTCSALDVYPFFSQEWSSNNLKNDKHVGWQIKLSYWAWWELYIYLKWGWQTFPSVTDENRHLKRPHTFLVTARLWPHELSKYLGQHLVKPGGFEDIHPCQQDTALCSRYGTTERMSGRAERKTDKRRSS